MESLKSHIRIKVHTNVGNVKDLTCVDLNVLPLGSYDVLIGMDWLEGHRVKLDCYNKTFECMNEKGNLVLVKGIPKVISVRQVSTM